MLPIVVVLVFVAFVLALASVSGRVPLWASVFVLCLIELLQQWPR